MLIQLLHQHLASLLSPVRYSLQLLFVLLVALHVELPLARESVLLRLLLALVKLLRRLLEALERKNIAFRREHTIRSVRAKAQTHIVQSTIAKGIHLLHDFFREALLYYG